MNVFIWITFFDDCICYTKESGVMSIILFFQRNGKVPLPWWKHGNYPVIPIYAFQLPFGLKDCLYQHC